jgi:cytochrome c-type biogenesis protein CcmH
MKMFALVFFFLFSLGSISSPLFATEAPNEELLQARVKEVSKTLRCAVCQSESVWESNAELAIQMRGIIRERLIQGESPDQIRAYFQSRYGDFILLKPRFAFGINWLLWGGPFLLLLIGGAALWRTLRGWVAQTTSHETETLPPLGTKDRERIEREMRSLE